MGDVTPLFKENQGECGCGCGVFGTLRASAWRDGVRCVARKCKCKRCMGRRNTKGGDAKARRARRGLRIAGPNTRHEEHWRGTVRTEVKSGGKARPVETAYRWARAQSDAAQPAGALIPFVASFAPAGSSAVYFVIRDDDLEAAVLALAEVFDQEED